MDSSTTADSILRGVGGEQNVQSLTHCMTRLRFVLKDHAQVDRAALRAVPGVVTTAEAGGQLQVVIGSEVPEVYAAIGRISHLTAAGGGDPAAPPVAGEPRGTLLNRFISMIAAVFTPLVWVLAASGLIKAFLAGAVSLGWIDPASSTHTVLNATGDAFIYFLPVMLAVTAAKHFRADQFTSLAIACALVYPTIVTLNDAPGLTLFGIPFTAPSYVSSVLPILVMVWLQSHVESFLRTRIHATVRRFLTPMVVLLILVPVTFLVVGPISNVVSSAVGVGIGWVFTTVPVVGGALIGGLWQVFVIFGLHWGLSPLITLELQTNGFSALVPPIFAAVLAQAAAVLGVFLRTRNRRWKVLAGPAAFSGFVAGVTEPAIYGVNLPLRRPFAFGIVGGVVGGAVVAAGGAVSNSLVIPSGLAIPAIIGSGNLVVILLGLALAVIIPLVLTLVFGFVEPSRETTAVDAAGDLDVRSPFDGRVVALSAVPDAAFAGGGLGDGVAIEPTGSTVHAPFAGEVVAVFPTGHAIGLRSAGGVEVLVHVGLDTVHLAGDRFRVKVAQGAHVALGDVLIEFDRAAMEADGLDLTSPVIVTNAAAHPVADRRATGAVLHGDPLFFAAVSASKH